MGARMRDLMRFEMTLSARVLRYVHDVEGGRVEPDRLSGYHDFPDKDFKLGKAMDELSKTWDVTAFLNSKQPQNPQYGQLMDELARLRANDQEQIVVDSSLFMRPGDTSDEFRQGPAAHPAQGRRRLHRGSSVSC